MSTWFKKSPVGENFAEVGMAGEKWLGTQEQTASDDLRQSIELRISAIGQGMNRATDLLIESTLDNETYLAKKKEQQSPP